MPSPKAREQAVQAYWQRLDLWKAPEQPGKEKYYILDMFPYPSGAGLHVGHLLGYYFSDTIALYQRLQGYNVLHPMGFDAFGLPAEQYAVATGQHPAVTTQRNIANYEKLLQEAGLSFDWDRKVCTSDPAYYQWTQWIFLQFFSSWYNVAKDRAEPIATLVRTFEQTGSAGVANTTETPSTTFSAQEWQAMSLSQQEKILSEYRLAYRAEALVNWCPALGTVLANEEVKEGRSERGGHPVEQKRMVQWKLRITAYADRLLEGLAACDWPEATIRTQANWIGKSEGATVHFRFDPQIAPNLAVFTTAPETIFGASFLVLAPEHPLVETIIAFYEKERSTPQQKGGASDYWFQLTTYIAQAKKRSERLRMQEATNPTGCFTGLYATHPLTGEAIPVWIGDYVLPSYGTGAVMGVPAHDARDKAFALRFGLPIIPVLTAAEEPGQEATLFHSSFLDGHSIPQAKRLVCDQLIALGKGHLQTNYRLRDPVFSRQRYWGEPFPIYYHEGIPHPLPTEALPLTLPPVDSYQPSTTGAPPLSRAIGWQTDDGYPLEQNTMPSWAGSSWYFFRYMDPHNKKAFANPEKLAYWKAVDLYVGGIEHATGHLLYARFFTKFLYDLGLAPIHEPFPKLINQGMIQGVSALVYRVKGTNQFVTHPLKDHYDTTPLHVSIDLVREDNTLDLDAFRAWREDLKDATFILEQGQYHCGRLVEKMSKSKHNTVDPYPLFETYGSDALRLHLLFLGPICQPKPWNTRGIEGQARFLKRVEHLFYHSDESLKVTEAPPTAAAIKALHQATHSITTDLGRYALNTCISALMVLANELTRLSCTSKAILQDFLRLLAPFAPHTAEFYWQAIGHQGSILQAGFPTYDPALLKEEHITYPVAVNGKTRFMLDLPAATSKAEVAALLPNHPTLQRWLKGAPIKKLIFVPQRMINVVAGSPQD